MNSRKLSWPRWSSISSHPLSTASSSRELLLSNLKLALDRYQMEEILTILEIEKINHHPNYVSKTTRYSTLVSSEHRPFKDIILELHQAEIKKDFLHSLVKKKLKELKDYRLDGFNKVTLRDLIPHAKECLPSNKSNKEDCSEAPATDVTYFGTIHWEVESIIKCFDVLPCDVIDLIVSNLPTKDIFHYRSVCKRWYSMLTSSPSFRSSFRASSNRRPWFLLLDTVTSPKRKNSSSSTILPEAVYNMEVSTLGDWCQFNINIPTTKTVSTTRTHKVDFVSFGGLICSMSGSNSFIVCNPCTGSSHHLPPLLDSEGGHSIKGMALHVSPCAKLQGRLRYQVFVVIVKKDRTLQIKTYSSSLNSEERGAWTEKLQLNLADPFLNVWNPKKIVGVTTIGEEGQILLHFGTRDGSKSFCCDTGKGTIFMNPRFLPSLQCCKVSELVVCDRTLYAVLILSGNIQQPLASTQLQVYQHTRNENNNNALNKWRHITTLPEEISAKCCINKKDHDHAISCTGYGNYIMVYVTCASSNFTNHSYYAFMFSIKEKAWVLLPPQPSSLSSSHTRTGRRMEICSLMPDID